MIFNQCFNFIDIFFNIQRFQLDHAHVAQRREGVVFIPDIRNTATHASGKVTTGFAKYDNTTAGHVFTTVITNTFNNRQGTTVTHAETFGRNASEIGFTGSCTV